MSETTRNHEDSHLYEYRLNSEIGPQVQDAIQAREAWARGETVAQGFDEIGEIIIPLEDLALLQDALATYDYFKHPAPFGTEEPPALESVRAIIENIDATFRAMVLHDAANRGFIDPEVSMLTVDSGRHNRDSTNSEWHTDISELFGAEHEPTLRYVIAMGAATQFLPGPLKREDLDSSGHLPVDSDLNSTPQEQLDQPPSTGNLKVILFSGHSLHREPPADNKPRLFLTAWVHPVESQQEPLRMLDTELTNALIENSDWH